ncbi:LCP family glycopolymer transferase [Vagococcus teuberi]|uniref:Transcriptional regulator n=1 Tax=Vagococcus teuberi TaxID=519472 RepID=A0A1J0A528_9ENTE|nr:LCP family protein [Vagococcus teuberi]APB31043.1 transcriptional regulator [Vagococcus teuberi]
MDNNSRRHKKVKKKSSGLKKTVIALLTILLVILAGTGIFLAKTYFDVKDVANKVSAPVKGRPDDKNIQEGQPFSVLLLGIDTGDFGRNDVGRSDTMLVATVNPKEKKTTLISIPRDTRTEIVGHDTVEKVAHAYAYGQAKMAMDTVDNLLDMKLNHYVWINMMGFEELVNAVDGVEVTNKFEFEQDGMTFKKGPIKLNGEEALAYTRMRYEDPNGDYGRQARQQQVIEAIANKALGFTGVKRYKEILKAIENNMKTDLEPEEMFDIAMKYRDSFKNVQSETLQGEGVMIDGISYQEIPQTELVRVQNLIKSQLK